MEVEAVIQKKKELYSNLLDFIESSNDLEYDFNNLINVIEKQEIMKDHEQILNLFHIMSNIADNHVRTYKFFDKFEQIFIYINENKKVPILNSDLFQNFKTNKRLLLLLLERGILVFDNPIKKFLMSKRDYKFYLYPTVKHLLDQKNQKSIEDQIVNTYNESVDSFSKKCKIGENDLYICQLIREDSITEFISFINQKQIKLDMKITPSIFETNSFLIDKKPTLIEYAAFYGSIQIFQHLKYGNVELNPSLWLYSIHSNNPDLIHILEDNSIIPEDTTFKKCADESIKCHHNNIFNYIFDCKMNVINKLKFNSILECYNYYFLPNDVNNLISDPYKEFGFSISMFCSSIEKLTIPTSVKSIGCYAFDGCSSILEIEIPSTVTLIDQNAFNFCSSLIKINIPSSVKLIGEGAFSGCSSLTELEITSSVTSIEDYAFYECSSLKEITIPSSVTKINQSVFKQCSSLEKVVILSELKSIGKGAFLGCFKLKEFTIPSSVNLIDEDAFMKCTSLMKIEIPPLCASLKSYCFSECSSLTQVIIPSSVSHIPSHAFFQCGNLKEIKFQCNSSLLSIGSNAFGHCSSLNEISIPPRVNSIGEGSFNGCSSLIKIVIPSCVQKIEKETFSNCIALKVVSFVEKSSVVSFGASSFAHCTNLKDISIPSSLESIEYNCFNGCSSLREILIPSSVKYIGNFAFVGCSSLEYLYISEKLYRKLNSNQYSGLRIGIHVEYI